jgi:hypothetical protein
MQVGWVVVALGLSLRLAVKALFRAANSKFAAAAQAACLAASIAGLKPCAAQELGCLFFSVLFHAGMDRVRLTLGAIARQFLAWDAGLKARATIPGDPQREVGKERPSRRGQQKGAGKKRALREGFPWNASVKHSAQAFAPPSDRYAGFRCDFFQRLKALFAFCCGTAEAVP